MPYIRAMQWARTTRAVARCERFFLRPLLVVSVGIIGLAFFELHLGYVFVAGFYWYSIGYLGQSLHPRAELRDHGAGKLGEHTMPPPDAIHAVVARAGIGATVFTAAAFSLIALLGGRDAITVAVTAAGTAALVWAWFFALVLDA